MKKKSMSLLALCLAASMIFAGTVFASEPTHEEPIIYVEGMMVEEREDEHEEKAQEAEEKAEDYQPEGEKVDAVWEEPVERPEAPTTVTEITDGTSKGDVNEAPAEVVTETPEETKTEYTAEPVQEATPEASAEAAAVETDMGMEDDPVIIESGEITYDDEEWGIEAFESLTYVVTGIQDFEFAVGAGHKYDIHHGVTINSKEVISSVLFDTSKVDFGTPGTYDITYIVYFHRVMFAGWLDLYDIDHADYPGVDSDADRIKVTVTATVTVTGDETSEEQSVETTAENEPQVFEAVMPKGSNVVWTYSVLEADSNEITDDMLSDWYFNYVEPSGHTWDVIVYTDKPDMGVFAQFDLVQKDTYLQVDNEYRDAVDDDIQSTYYRAIDGELVVVVEAGEL